MVSFFIQKFRDNFRKCVSDNHTLKEKKAIENNILSGTVNVLHPATYFHLPQDSNHHLCQNCFYLISFQILQLTGESSTRFWIGSLATALIFGVKGSFLVLLFTPVIPTFGKNVFSQFATDKYSLSIRTPGTGKIYFCSFRFCGELAVVKNVRTFSLCR